MAALSYQVQYIPDPVFWAKLAKLPLPKGDYPEMLILEALAEFNTDAA